MANDTQAPSVLSLAKQVLELSARISTYLDSSAHVHSELRESSAEVPSSEEYEALRAPLNDAALDLLRLINGPKNTLRSFFFSHYDLAALQVALDRRFFHHVPLMTSSSGSGGEILSNGNCITKQGATIRDIALKANMDEDRTGRIMRLLATHRIFEEDTGERDVFRHTAASALLARDNDFHATADMQHPTEKILYHRMDDMLKAVSQTSALIKKSPYVSSTENSPFATAYGMKVYQYYEENPEKGKRFAQAMSSWSQLDRQISELRDAFPWETLGSGKVVDIGGGSGHISIALAQQYPFLHFVVQDISPNMLSQSQDSTIASLKDRISFQQHDFFQPQPIHDAGAFLLRQCLHNYNDADCVKIIKAVVPALEKCKKGTPFLINDVIMPKSGSTTRYEEHHLRQVDFCMLVVLGAKQRSEEDFVELLKEADSRFKIVNVYNNALGVGLLEVHLNV
ncbi:S-adenosyl-L-methionine-dependent methyltransferase [Dendryphion nanum]|uniref:S-adenosyl-L-methionine-dependent methyltransferase n=1 Tax=Dendryphion nanum TaxID=256645 RepID=A0A9P9EGK3_9PLEO|nr:S-adenosyl-L-methionine-dependent methyltransferase [Dendryphion nanum]